MIQTKQDLKFYIVADRIMNGRIAKRGIAEFFSGGGNYPLLTGNEALRILSEHHAEKTLTSHDSALLLE